MRVTAAAGLALTVPDNHRCELLGEILFERLDALDTE
jgi:hypothetical protein